MNFNDRFQARGLTPSLGDSEVTAKKQEQCQQMIEMSAAFAHPAVIPSCFERLQTLSALSQVFPLFWRRT